MSPPDCENPASIKPTLEAYLSDDVEVTGLTWDTDYPSKSEAPPKTYEYSARCYSEDCAPHRNSGTAKPVSRTTTFCQECGHALVWTKRVKR